LEKQKHDPMKNILTLLIVFFSTGIFPPAIAQLPERTPANIEKYKAICRKYIYKEMKGM
jgi:hypothetical protein